MRRFLVGFVLLSLGGCAAWQPAFNPDDLKSVTATDDPLIVRDPVDGLRKVRALRTLAELAARKRRDATFYASEVAFYGTLLAGIGVSTESIATRNAGGGAALLATLVPGRYQLPKQREAFLKAAEKAACLEQRLVEAGVWYAIPAASDRSEEDDGVPGMGNPTPLQAAHKNLLDSLTHAIGQRKSQDKQQAEAVKAAKPFVVDPAIEVAESRANAVVRKFEADRAALPSETTDALRAIVQSLQASLDAVVLSSLTRDQIVQLIKKSKEDEEAGAVSAREVVSQHLPGEEAAQTAATAGALAKFNEEAPLCAAL